MLENFNNFSNETIENLLFGSIGKKIKLIALALCTIGIVMSIFVAINLFSNNNGGLGVVVIIFGSIGSWLSSSFIYGFGKLIENSNNIYKELKKISQNNKSE